MLQAADLVKAFERNTRIIEHHADGLSHEESLAQSPYSINCMNWTVGHIVWYRDVLLEFLGEELVAGKDRLARYVQESDPITEDGGGVVPFAELLALARATQDRLASVLGAMSEEDFAAERVDGDRTRRVGSSVHFNYFHDTYHAGQTEVLRQVSRPDA